MISGKDSGEVCNLLGSLRYVAAIHRDSLVLRVKGPARQGRSDSGILPLEIDVRN
jgi:hypothetical protein